MKPTDPQFIYMVLILPSLFGITLVGEGVYKLTQEKAVGWFNIFMGIVFLVVVFVSFSVLSGMFN